VSVARTTRLRARLPAYLRQAAAVLAFLVGWEIVGRTAGIFAIPPFHVVLTTLIDMIQSGELWEPTAGTLLVAATGYACAAVVGVALGVALGLSATLRAGLDPVVNAAYATPMAMFIPIIGLYLGLDFLGQVFLVVTFCVFIVLMNTTAGVRAVPTEYWELGRSMRLSYAGIVGRIVLPHSLPYIMVGLRVSVARAVAGAITAELLMSTTDLGLYLSQAGSRFDFNRLVAGTLWVALLGIIPVVLAYWVERRVTSWRGTVS
jgi:ABC-type nitrate/sulfonate/bicarbonate transport system permease component